MNENRSFSFIVDEYVAIPNSHIVDNTSKNVGLNPTFKECWRNSI
jgi:hypothetical protein